jgi:uncharacterized protein (TIGR01777 family)
MRILIAGSSGLIGSALTTALQGQGHTLARLVRRAADNSRREVYWDPERGSLDKSPLVDIAPEVVINLAGENIAGGRWTDRRKAAIRDSRVNGTRVLSQAITSLEPKPKIFLCASAVGYYGDRGDTVLMEDSGPGDNFLSKVCQDWELATEPAREAGIRVVNLRIGVVLSKKGGALKKMLLPFRLGLGGVIGNGRQYFSWITLEDLVRVFLFAMEHSEISGPVNAVAPHPVTNKQFTKALGKALVRPTLRPMPASTARLAFGEMADELLLASARAQPGVLEGAGFQFQQGTILTALRAVLK